MQRLWMKSISKGIGVLTSFEIQNGEEHKIINGRIKKSCVLKK